MLRTLYIAFRLKNTYTANSIIYWLRQLPILKKHLPLTLYKSKIIKILANIIAVFLELAKTIISKLLYMLIMIYLVTLGFNNLNLKMDAFAHILFFLTIIGVLFNTKIFAPSKDRYYAIAILRMNAKNFGISNYIYEMIKVFVGFLISSIFFYSIGSLTLKVAIMIPFFVVSCKSLGSVIEMYEFQNDKKLVSDGISIGLGFICFIFAYGLPFVNIVISQNLFFILSLLFLLLGMGCAFYIVTFKNYKRFFKKIFSNGIASYDDVKKILKENEVKKIDDDASLTSVKVGFEFLNDLFIKRHRKLLMNSAVRISYIATGIIVVLGLLCILVPEVASGMNRFLHYKLPWLLYITSFMNRSEAITRAMFMNCDHSLLTYSFYRKPKNIVKLFIIRLRDIVKINLIPSGILAFGSIILLFISGGTSSGYLYLLLCISILAMNVLFSVHHLAIYYLLQPYNIEAETKSSMYIIINFILYMLCYVAINLELSTLIFSLFVIIVSSLYCGISLFLVYKYAYKTFRIHG